MGDVMLKNNDKLNMNHESLTKLYPARVKKGKEVKAPKEKKSEQVTMSKAKKAKGVGGRVLPTAVDVAKSVVVKNVTKKSVGNV